MNSSAKKLLQVHIAQVDEVTKNSFSTRIYGIEWSQYLPLQLSEDEYVFLADFATASQFIKTNHTSIFELDQWGNPFYNEENNETKKRYYAEMADSFIFCKGTEIYGIIIGTPVDWSSYYLRYGAFKKEFRNGGRTQKFVSYLIQILKQNSINRIETDIAPSNFANIHVFSKLQFNINGMTLSERWGALIHFTKILNPNAEKVFLDQFCVGSRSQLNESNSNVIPINRTLTKGDV